MHSSRILYTLILTLVSGFSVLGNSDSLWSIWHATENHDTIRHKALRELINEYLRVQPDSSRYCASVAIEDAKKKGLKKYEALALNDMAVIAWMQSDFQQAIDYFNQTQPLFEALDDKQNLAGGIINRAGCFQGMGQYDSALAYYRKGIAFCESFGERRFRTNALANLGNLYSYLEQYDSALFYFKQVEPIAKESENHLALGATYGNMGLVYVKQGNYSAAFDYFDRALLIHRKSKDLRARTFVLKHLGEAYRNQKEYDLALQYLDSALISATDFGEKALMASTLLAKSHVLSDLGRNDESLKIALEALEISKEMNSAVTTINALHSVAACYHDVGDLENARKYFEESLAISQENNDTRQITHSLLSLGGVYADLGQYGKARELVERGMEMAKKAGNIQSMMHGADNLVKIYSNLGLSEKTVEMHSLYTELLDSVNNEENKKAAIRREYKFSYENQAMTDSLTYAAEKAVKDKELHKRKLIGRVLGVGLVLMLVFTIVFLRQRIKIGKEKNRSEALLHNILPEEVALELKQTGEAEAKVIQNTTVIFTDFKGFTSIASEMSPKELVADIHSCFSAFDKIMEKYGIEKIKTIGDAYMAAAGVPQERSTSAKDVIHAAFEICQFIEQEKKKKIEEGKPYFEIRIGVHTGPVVAGIVGIKKFQYDIWGDTVNTASRMESSGDAGKVNVSQATYDLIKNEPQFVFEHRGKIQAKGKGEINMYFVSLG